MVERNGEYTSKSRFRFVLSRTVSGLLTLEVALKHDTRFPSSYKRTCTRCVEYTPFDR